MYMKKIDKEKIALRANISALANQNIEVLKAKKRVDGEKLTKEQVIEYMLLNFNETNGKRNKTS